jgi:hypothetical protein
MKKTANYTFHFSNKKTKFRQQKKHTFFKKNNFPMLMILFAFLFLMILGNSCKTCKCPSYSEIGQNTAIANPVC